MNYTLANNYDTLICLLEMTYDAELMYQTDDTYLFLDKLTHNYNLVNTNIRLVGVTVLLCIKITMHVECTWWSTWYFALYIFVCCVLF